MKIQVRVDAKGRIIIPKTIREKAGIRPGDLVEVGLEDGKIRVVPVGSNAEKLYGIFNVEKWPEDLDEFLVEAARKWWKGRHTST